MVCPNPGCERELAAAAPSGVCGCEYGEPLTTCPVCGSACRAGADYCRCCRALLGKSSSASGQLESQKPESVTVSGTYHQAPCLSAGHLWMVSEPGEVFRLSPFGSAAREWTCIASKEVAFNSLCLAGATRTGRSSGPLLLATDPTGVYSVSLVSGESRKIMQQSGTAELICNTSAPESVRFSGAAAGNDFFCYLQREPRASVASLAVQYFSAGRATEVPLKCSGQRFLGPVVNKRCICFCGEEEIHVADISDGFRSSQPIIDFEPFFERPPSLVNVPPGGMPLAVSRTGGRTEAWIGGRRDNKAGVMHLSFDTQKSDFTPLPEGSSFGFRSADGIWVNTVADLRFFGRTPRHVRLPSLDKAMPVASGEGVPLCFARSIAGGQRAVCIAGEAPEYAALTDRQFNENSCCGIFQGGGFLAAVRFGSKENTTDGLTVSRWNLRTTEL